MSQERPKNRYGPHRKTRVRITPVPGGEFVRSETDDELLARLQREGNEPAPDPDATHAGTSPHPNGEGGGPGPKKHRYTSYGSRPPRDGEPPCVHVMQADVFERIAVEAIHALSQANERLFHALGMALQNRKP